MKAGFGRTENGWQWFNGASDGGADIIDFIGILGGRRGRAGSSGRGAGWRGGRMFEQGDLRLVVLRLLEEKPRHGYDIMKAMEEETGGVYSPSPGAVYPTLQLLEELGHARSVEEEGNRKSFEITDPGRTYLAEHRSVADELTERLRGVAGASAEAYGEFAHAFEALGKAAIRTASRAGGDQAKLSAVRQIIERAEHDIQLLG